MTHSSGKASSLQESGLKFSFVLVLLLGKIKMNFGSQYCSTIFTLMEWKKKKRSYILSEAKFYVLYYLFINFKT